MSLIEKNMSLCSYIQKHQPCPLYRLVTVIGADITATGYHYAALGEAAIVPEVHVTRVSLLVEAHLPNAVIARAIIKATLHDKAAAVQLTVVIPHPVVQIVQVLLLVLVEVAVRFPGVDVPLGGLLGGEYGIDAPSVHVICARHLLVHHHHMEEFFFVHKLIVFFGSLSKDTHFLLILYTIHPTTTSTAAHPATIAYPPASIFTRSQRVSLFSTG